MTTEVTTLSKHHSVLDARELMSNKGIRHIPITDAQGIGISATCGCLQRTTLGNMIVTFIRLHETSMARPLR
ncbi:MULTISPECIES: CBS domain-containing protein [unclassified Oleiphilus]